MAPNVEEKELARTELSESVKTRESAPKKATKQS